MPVTVLDGRSPFRLTLASPAEVDSSGAVILTPANLVESAGEFATITTTGDVTVGGVLAVTGDAEFSNGVNVAGTLSAPSGTTAVRALAAEQGVTAGGLLTASGGVLATLPTYADNAAAVAGGLATNRLYKTATGEVRIVVA